MILACGVVVFRSDVIEDLAAMLPSFARECRKSAGCHFFSMAVADKSTGEVAICEIWENQALLTTHLKRQVVQDFIGKFASAIKTNGMKHYDISGERPAPSAEEIAKTRGT
jgi:quinol monooxygenase YgiN